MKKYILLFAAAGLLTGCFDLDQLPHDKLNSGTFWKTENHAHQGMMSIYNQMKKKTYLERISGKMDWERLGME